MLKLLRACISPQSTKVIQTTVESKPDNATKESHKPADMFINDAGDQKYYYHKALNAPKCLHSASRLNDLYVTYETCELQTFLSQQPVYTNTDVIDDPACSKLQPTVQSLISKIPFINKSNKKVHPSNTTNLPLKPSKKYKTDKKYQYKPIFLPPYDKINFTKSTLKTKNLLNCIADSSNKAQQQKYFAQRFHQMGLMERRTDMFRKTRINKLKVNENKKYKKTNSNKNRKSKRRPSPNSTTSEFSRLNYVINWLSMNRKMYEGQNEVEELKHDD